MRIVFKIIAIIGVLSFLGGLKNGVLFFGGLILAGIFGYFGWRPEKSREEQRGRSINSNSENHESVGVNSKPNNLIPEDVTQQRQKDEVSYHNLPESLLVDKPQEKPSSLDSYKKLKLLDRSFEQGLLTKSEYEAKANEIHILVKQDRQSQNEAAIQELLLRQNKEFINQLEELLSSGLLNQEEFEDKKTNLLSTAGQRYEEEMALSDPSFIVDRSRESGLYGYLNKNNNIVIEHKFNKAYPFYENLAHVVINDKSGYIDESGVFVINPIYDYLSCSHFKDGRATVSLDGRVFQINNIGEEIV